MYTEYIVMVSNLVSNYVDNVGENINLKIHRNFKNGDYLLLSLLLLLFPSPLILWFE